MGPLAGVEHFAVIDDWETGTASLGLMLSTISPAGLPSNF